MKHLLMFVAFAPWVAIYLGIAYVCVKKGLMEKSPRGMHPIGSAIGFTCCVMWVVAVPFLFFCLAVQLGLLGSLGATIACACIYLASRCQGMKNTMPLQALLWVIACAAFIVGLMIAMPYPPIDLPPYWQSLQCLFCSD
jgi:hypothetical protein